MDFKKILYFGVLPALLTGIISASPYFYKIIKEPKAELTYSYFTGPGIQDKDGYKQILSLNVSNSGKKSLTNVIAKLKIDDAKIESYKIENKTGLKTDVIKLDNEISISVHKLHAGENFSLLSLVLLSKNGILPSVALRSDEVLGSQSIFDSSKQNELLSPMLAFLSVLFMTFFIYNFYGGKEDFLYYIYARFKLPGLDSTMYLNRKYLTYLKMADILLNFNLKATNEEERKESLKALKCLVLVKSIASVSLEVIKSNLKTIEGEDFSEKEFESLRNISVSVEKKLKLRTLVDKIADGTLEFE